MLLSAFASKGQVKVLGYVVPNSPTDAYPTHLDIYGSGGYRTVTSLVDRNAITPLRRKAGMLVYVIDSSKIYQLGNDLVTWSSLTVGSGSGGSNGSNEVDPIFTNHIAYTITQAKIDLWNQIARLPLYSTTDSMRKEIHDSVSVHDYNFNPAWFTVTNRNVDFNGSFAYQERDSLFFASVAASISQEDIDRWNANVDLTNYYTKDQTDQNISDSLQKYKYYFDGATIKGTGKIDNPFHVVPFGDTAFYRTLDIYTKEQVDSAIAANFREYSAGYGLVLENQTFRLDTSLLKNNGGGFGGGSDTAVQDIVGFNSNTLRVIKKSGYYDIVYGLGTYSIAQIDSMFAAIRSSAGGGGTGTVTNVSVVNTFGLTGTVANPATTPSISMTIDTSKIVTSNRLNTVVNNFGDSLKLVRNYIDTNISNLQTQVTNINNNGTSSGGTVKSVAVVNTFGLSGTVANPTTTPSITMTIDSTKYSTVNNVNTSINTVVKNFRDSLTANKQVNSDWNATSGVAQILNKPTLYAPPKGDSVDYSISTYTTIYNENGPGEAAVSSSNPTINPDNFNFPLRQLKSLDIGGWTQNDYISFTYPVAKNATAYTFIRGFIRLKQAVPVNQSLGVQFFNNGVAVSQRISIVNYGLDKNLINQYQNIVIQMNAFGFASNTFNEVRLNFGGVGTVSSGLYLDLFQFQNATAQENTYVTDILRLPGSTQVYKIVGGQTVPAYIDSVGGAGGGGDLLISNYIVGEVLSGTVNGTNTVFTLANTTVANKEMIFINGVKQKRGVDYTITNSNTVTFTSPPTTDASGTDYIEATYFKQ